VYSVLQGNWGERDRYGDIGVDWCLILGWACGERPVFSFLVGKADGKRPLGRPRRRCVDNIRMDLWEGGCIGSWCGNRRERDHWGDLGVDGWIILGWISG